MIIPMPILSASSTRNGQCIRLCFKDGPLHSTRVRIAREQLYRFQFDDTCAGGCRFELPRTASQDGGRR